MFKKSLAVGLAGVVAFVFSGCGTLFWSERKTETPSMEIDPTVLILDCCGLFFGIVPGVVALVLDFNNNTIYFSKSEARKRSANTELDQSKMVAFHVEHMDRASIEAALSEQLGYQVSLNGVQLSAIR